MLWWYFPLLFATGMFVGFINTIAGSGSFLSLPVLIFTGMPANVANGTNRISILMSSLTGVLSFNKKGFFDIRNALILAAFVIPGAIAGTFFVIEIP
ncbi:MAG TPA: TSUP family transporter, partial [Bacteroidales bacterium]|nr:TSUP family transporter [Bacteroidales bacterium]